MLSVTRRVFAVAVALGALVVSAGVPVHGQGGEGGGRWSKAAPFPEPQEELYGLTTNGKLYVVGGFGTDGTPQALMYEYDPAADKWTKKKNMPLPVHHQAQAVFQGKLYTFGGCLKALTGEASVDNTFEYNPETDTWRAMAPMPGKRCSANAEEVGGKIYVIGGFGPFETGAGTRVVGTNQAFNPATNTWEERSPMPTSRNHAFAGAVNGKIYMIGGRTGGSGAGNATPTDVVEEYDPAKNTWGPLKVPMPTPRSGGGYATCNGKVVVAGGEWTNRMFSAAYKALEAYNPATNTWEIWPSMPVAKHGQGTGCIGNRLYLASGTLTPGSGFGPDWSSATKQTDVLEIPTK